MAPTKGRALGVTEQSWCRAVSGGTGTTVVAFLNTRAPDVPLLQNALQKIQNAHPVLRSTIHPDPTSPTYFSFITSPSSTLLRVESFDLPHTTALLRHHHSPASPFHLIVEHELNRDTWTTTSSDGGGSYSDVFFTCVYALPDNKWALVLRFHTAACDRATAVGLLKELVELTAETPTAIEAAPKKEVELPIEDLVPREKRSKTLWTRGVDVLGYSVKSLRLTNLKFQDVKGNRGSEVVRLRMDFNDTTLLLAGCKTRGIKLCGALAAAGMIAAHSLKRRRIISDLQTKKYYGIVTLADCRSAMAPPLSSHDFGFYHAAIMNVHNVKGGEQLWELATRSYAAFATSKKSNKHLSDMADLNFLMCKAIDNPSLTPSSSQRTSFMSLFEDTVFDDSGDLYDDLGLEDYIGCSSVHGVGPSIAIFDTVRDGKLDCACVYPAPLHSREQMVELVEKMRSLLVEAGRSKVGGGDDEEAVWDS